MSAGGRERAAVTDRPTRPASLDALREQARHCTACSAPRGCCNTLHDRVQRHGRGRAVSAAAARAFFQQDPQRRARMAGELCSPAKPSPAPFAGIGPIQGDYEHVRFFERAAAPLAA
jgi:hypothetical protein